MKGHEVANIKEARLQAAHFFLVSCAGFAGLGLFINLGLYLSPYYQFNNPQAQGILYTIILGFLCVWAFLSLKWIHYHLEVGMWAFALGGTLSVSCMLSHYVFVQGGTTVPHIVFSLHLGVFMMGMTLGFGEAVLYATLTTFVISVVGFAYQNHSDSIILAMLAYGMALPAWLVSAMERVLRRSEEKFSLVFRASPDVTLILDKETGEILQANEAAHAVLGYTPHTLTGRHFSFLYPPAVGAVTSDIAAMLDGGDELYNYQEVLRADGQVSAVETSITEIPWEKDEATLITLRDVTDRQVAEEELRQYREHLEEMVKQRTAELATRNKELDAFAHTVAHDLKGPLTRLIGASSLLRMANSLSREDQDFYLESLEREGYKMSNIIDELLLLASVRKSTSLNLTRLDMNVIVADAQERLAPMIAQYKATLEVSKQWLPARGYRPWIEQVWVNYLSNALKYGGRPPVIRIGCEIVEPEASHICFWVQDNGKGLTDEEQAQLFTPFTRISDVSIEGYGLGLSIVERIVTKLDGEVGVESTVGEGSRFTFTLPRWEDGA
jgi:PAS domain S-box-containing protein